MPAAAVAPNDHIQVAAIGIGIMGFNHCATTVKIPGVNVVAACDLYTCHLKRAKDVYGQDVATTTRFDANVCSVRKVAGPKSRKR